MMATLVSNELIRYFENHKQMVANYYKHDVSYTEKYFYSF